MLFILSTIDPIVTNEERFQDLLKQMEEKFEAEQVRVRQWLEENDML